MSPPDASSPAVRICPLEQLVHTFELTYSFDAQIVTSQTVSSPDLLSLPSALVVPTAQDVHTFEATYSSTPQVAYAKQVVSVPDASAPPDAYVSPPLHAVHTFDTTFWLTPQIVATLATVNAPLLVGQVIVHESHPVAAAIVPRAVTVTALSVSTLQPNASQVAALVLVVHVFSSHVGTAGQAALLPQVIGFVPAMLYPASH